MDRLVQIVNKLEEKHPVGLPVIYQLLASFFLATNTLFVKLLQRIPATQFLVVRSIITMTFVTIVANKYRIDCYSKEQFVMIKLIGRGIFGAFGAIMYFTALKLISLSEAIVLHKTLPFWTAMLSILVLKKESFNFILLINIMICIFGVACISQPPVIKKLFHQEVDDSNYENHTLGVVLALLSAVVQSIIQILISSLGTQVNQLAILQYFSFFTVFVPMIYQLYTPFEEFLTPTLYEAIIMSFAGFCGALGQLFMNQSFIKGNLTQMSLVGQSQVLMNFMYDVLVLKHMLSALSIFGSLLVTSSLIFSIKSKKQKAK